jgi:hypothetical protein
VDDRSGHIVFGELRDKHDVRDFDNGDHDTVDKPLGNFDRFDCRYAL